MIMKGGLSTGCTLRGKVTLAQIGPKPGVRDAAEVKGEVGEGEGEGEAGGKGEEEDEGEEEEKGEDEVVPDKRNG